MSGKRDIAWVADKMVAKFKSDLPAKLTALTTEYGDSVAMPSVANDNYFITEVRLVPGFPLVCVIPDQTDTAPYTGEGRYNIEYHDLTIALAHAANSGEDLLKRTVVRMARALQEVLLDSGSLGGSVEDVLVISKAYGPMLMSEDALMQEAQIRVRVQTMS